MSVTTPCSENITSETLSAWGDGGLSEVEVARLRAHAAGCLACQERLRAYNQVSQLISGQRIPAAPPVDIAAIRAESHSQRGTPHTGKRRLPRAVWGGLGAAMAAALLIAAFSQVFARLGHVFPTATVTPATTATRPIIKTLVWSQRTLPPGISLGRYPINFSTQASYEVNFAISPASSQNGWVCALTPDGTVKFWATTDQARTWRRMGSINPPATPTPINGCWIVPDQVSPTTLAVGLSWNNGAPARMFMVSYISGDDGQTWASLGSVPTPALATIGKRTYVITESHQPPYTQLIVSDDGLRTWRNVTPANDKYRTFTSLWPDPASGALLLSAGPGPGMPALWRSDDDGATWTQYGLNYMVTMGAWISAAHHWRLCATPSNGNASLMCTDNLGKTWNPQPSLSALTLCSDCNPNKNGAPIVLQTDCSPEALALDGSLLTMCQAAGTYTKDHLPVPSVYQLAPGSSTWKRVGPISGPWGKDSGYGYNLMFLTGDPSSSAGALWYTDPAANILVVGVLPS